MFDITSGATPCSDELILVQLSFINTFAPPVRFTPGDNEWTDRHRKNAGEFDLPEPLACLARSFFAQPKTAWRKVDGRHQPVG